MSASPSNCCPTCGYTNSHFHDTYVCIALLVVDNKVNVAEALYQANIINADRILRMSGYMGRNTLMEFALRHGARDYLETCGAARAAHHPTIVARMMELLGY